MSRRNRSRRSVRPTGPRPGTELSTLAAVEQFDAAITQAALANGVQSRAPAGHVQTIVPGANYSVRPNTKEAHERQLAAKRGVDPALNRKFETATEAREFRKREQVDTMSLKEFEAESVGKNGSRRYPAWLQGDTGDRDPQTGKKVEGFNPNAFRRGAEVMRQMGMNGVMG